MESPENNFSKTNEGRETGVSDVEVNSNKLNNWKGGQPPYDNIRVKFTCMLPRRT